MAGSANPASKATFITDMNFLFIAFPPRLLNRV
jgi:hypothetical protein